MTKYFFDNFIIKHPIKILITLFLGVIILAFYATKLQIDASSETLLLDDDKDLKFFREVHQRYHSPDFLVVTFKPNQDLLSKDSLETIKNISGEFEKLKRVSSVTSILNVPLLESPVQDLTKLVNGVRTLENSKVDKTLVKKEFLNSELYKNSLVSKDFKTTSILVNLKDDKKYFEILYKRNDLLAKKREGVATSEELNKLDKVSKEFKEYRDGIRKADHENIISVRKIIEKYQDKGELFLGGVTMIADDIIGFVKNDLVIYGTTLIAILILVLWIIFRQIIWIILPLVICTLSVVSTTGALGLFGWEVTVISSNFISLQLIITISIVLHLIVRYRELTKDFKHASQYKLIINTILSKLNPSFFAIITTVAGFGSLVLSGIQPVKNLGWMMSTGILISLLIAFIVFPAILILMDRIDIKKGSEFKLKAMPYLSMIVEKKGRWIFLTSFVLVLFSLTGVSRLVVENSFINYFKKSTQIYKGMEVIDNQLGGTTPLDVILTFDGNKKEVKSSKVDDEFSDFEDEFSQNADDKKYWFTPDKMNAIIRVHDYLESIDQIGKVSSLATLLKVGKKLNKGKDLDGFTLALLYEKLPTRYKDLILSPYVSVEDNQVRITTRLIDSNPNLRRDELIKKINRELPAIIDNSTIQFRLSNLMILYNNLLQSLFDSQIKTLGFVVVILFVMFLILFRSFLIAFVGMLSNIVPISILFGIMGWLNIPLDIMTITIAAISIGIGVDDTIHYIHRFHEELKKDHNYINAMERSHETIGYAMVYTSVAIILGFSILVLSNLIPTIYFGLLTVTVMITVLAADLLLLPRLLIIFKPYKKKHLS